MAQRIDYMAVHRGTQPQHKAAKHFGVTLAVEESGRPNWYADALYDRERWQVNGWKTTEGEVMFVSETTFGFSAVLVAHLDQPVMGMMGREDMMEVCNTLGIRTQRELWEGRREEAEFDRMSAI
jgi:hypothetical protein